MPGQATNEFNGIEQQRTSALHLVMLKGGAFPSLQFYKTMKNP
jgi:hypothetical protein